MTYLIDVREVDEDTEGNRTGNRRIAVGATEDPKIAAATLRAAADQLDPSQPPRPAYRSAADHREAADQRFREKLAGYDANEAPPSMADLRRAGASTLGEMVARDSDGLPTDATLSPAVAGGPKWETLGDGLTRCVFLHATNEGNEFKVRGSHMTPNRIEITFRNGVFEQLQAHGTQRPMGRGKPVTWTWDQTAVDGDDEMPEEWRKLVDMLLDTPRG